MINMFDPTKWLQMAEEDADGPFEMADGEPLLQIQNDQQQQQEEPPLAANNNPPVAHLPQASGFSHQRNLLSPRNLILGFNRFQLEPEDHEFMGGRRPLNSRHNSPKVHHLLSSPIDDSYIYRQDDISSIAFPSFDELRTQRKLLDIDLLVDGKRISAHRVVLAATIPFFSAMFTHDMRESSLHEIAISAENIDGPAFESLIDFAYTGIIRITACSVQSILVSASFLGLQKVCDACSEFLKVRLQPNNVLGIKSFAESLSCPNLVTAAKKFIEKFFETVSKSDEFLQLSSEDVVDIICHDELNVRGEETVFESVLNWVKYDMSQREADLPKLLTQVRLPLLTPQYITDFVQTETLIKGSHACRDLVDEAKDYHLMPERRPLLQSFRTRPRCCLDAAGIIYAVGGLTKAGDSLSTVETYDPLIGKWSMAEAMSMLRSRVGVAVMGSKLYAIGGYNGHERLSTVEVFDPEDKKWAKVSPMNCKRSAVGAATLHDRLYVCGGYDGVSSLNTVECYDSDRNEWKMVTSMSKHRSAAGVVSFEGYLVAIGGHDGLSIFDSVERFDPRENKWIPLQSMITRRCRLGVATLKNKLYVCGGYDGSTFLQSAEVYDSETKLWKKIADMNVMRSRVALVANGNRLYAIGGYDGISNLSSVEVYDPEKNNWSFVEPMVAHEGGVGVGVIPLF